MQVLLNLLGLHSMLTIVPRKRIIATAPPAAPAPRAALAPSAAPASSKYRVFWRELWHIIGSAQLAC